MTTSIKELLSSTNYSLIITLICIFLIIYSIFNKVKYLCLSKAVEMVAEVEKLTDLSGAEKFALVVLWIHNDFPKVFNNALIKSIIEKLVQYAYDKCYSYASRYIKRKTGMELQEAIENLSVKKSTIDINSKSEEISD